MAGSAYPHIVFATDEETLPKAELETLLGDLFVGHEPPPVTRQGALEVVLNLGEYAFTFWYDDEAEGLGGRYAMFAPAMKHRRISKCTTMIDFSGSADPDGTHAAHADTIATALAGRAGVYVFSEASKTFVAMDYADPFADPAPSGAASPVATPVAEEAAEEAAPPVPAAGAAAAEPAPVPEPEPAAAPTPPAAPAPAPKPAPAPPRTYGPSSPFAPAAAWAPPAREPQRPRTSIGQVPTAPAASEETAPPIGRVPVSEPARPAPVGQVPTTPAPPKPVETPAPTQPAETPAPTQPAETPVPPATAAEVAEPAAGVGSGGERPTEERYTPPFTAPWPEPGTPERSERPQHPDSSPHSREETVEEPEEKKGVFKRMFGRRKHDD